MKAQIGMLTTLIVLPLAGADMTHRQFTTLLIQGGVIPIEKASIALEAADSVELSPRLVNIATRGWVTDSSPLIAGIVVNQSKKKGRYVIRAVGPTLKAFGLADALEDPIIEVYKQGVERPIAENDDWQTNPPVLKQQMASVGAFPLANDTSWDAAMYLELEPGAYTVTVKRNSTALASKDLNLNGGTALVEVYELP